jgi:hypothetical protein
MEQLLSEMAEPFQVPEPMYLSSDVQRGNELEPLAVAEVEKYVGKKFIKIGWMQSTDCELIGASPDAITEDLTEIIETKCPKAKTHIGYIREDVVPSDYVDQVVHYFAVNPLLKSVHFASYRPECIKPLFVKTVTLETELNVGTKARPIIRTVNDYAKEKIELAKSLNLRLNEEFDKLTGI